MATPDFALDHYAAQLDLAVAAAQVAADLWSEVDPRNITESWAARVPEMEAVLAGAQLAAARQAEPYLDEAAAFADAVEDVADKVAPKAFAGIASDGRALASLLYQPAITSLLAIKSGHNVRTALASGRATLDMTTRTQVADAGRSAVQVGLTPRKKLEGQIRIAVGKSCSRCVILAGKWYAYNAGFDRHPNCDCVGLPARQAEAAGINQDPQRIYDLMTPQERSRAGWSYADQKAIAEGADLNQVTNIRRKGALYVADGKQYTREGAKTRARQGIKEPRKTPGQIYREAGDDRDEAIRLLRQHGYLYGPAKTAPTPAVDLRRQAVERPAIHAKAQRVGSVPVIDDAAVGPAVADSGVHVRPLLLEAKTRAQLAANFRVMAGFLSPQSRRLLEADFAGLDLATAAEYAEGLLRCMQFFPEVRLVIVNTFQAGRGARKLVYAEAGGQEISFNSYWGQASKRAEYLATLQKEAASGWSVRNSGNPMAVAIHEYGHILDVDHLGEISHEEITGLIAQRAAEAGTTPGLLVKREISEYAMTNTHELAAEAFLDVMINGTNASTLSREIFDILLTKHKEKAL